MTLDNTHRTRQILAAVSRPGVRADQELRQLSVTDLVTWCAATIGAVAVSYLVLTWLI